MIIINAEDMIVGRLGTFVAKKALLGEEVKIINCERAVVSGNKREVLAKYQRIRKMGVPLQGPYLIRTPEALVKRTIRGMLPYKQAKGREAFERVMCYRGTPEEFAGKDITKIEGSDISKVTKTNFMRIGEISKELGAKI